MTSVDSVREAVRVCRERPYWSVLDSVDRWAELWESGAHPLWSEVRARAGQNEPLEDAIRALARSARRDPVDALLREQVGGPEAFETAVPRGVGGLRKAIGQELAGVFLGGGAWLASWPVFLTALIARCGVWARLSSSDQWWPALFLRSLEGVDPELAATIRIERWPVTETGRTARLCQESEVVLAYGSDASMETIRASVPAATPFAPFGSRLSAAVICRDLPVEAAAALAARDLAIYDGAGCLSPQVFLVEGDWERGEAFSRALDDAVGRLIAQWPGDTRTAGQQAAIRSARELALMEEQSLVLGPDDLRWSVILSDEPGFLPSPLGRTAQVHVCSGDPEVAALLRPYSRVLQAVGVGTGLPSRMHELAGALGALGATRVAPLGKMQTPPLSWSHDGRAVLPLLVRLVDVEMEE